MRVIDWDGVRPLIGADIWVVQGRTGELRPAWVVQLGDMPPHHVAKVWQLAPSHDLQKAPARIKAVTALGQALITQAICATHSLIRMATTDLTFYMGAVFGPRLSVQAGISPMGQLLVLAPEDGSTAVIACWPAQGYIVVPCCLGHQQLVPWASATGLGLVRVPVMEED
jgi:hypothetical protein